MKIYWLWLSLISLLVQHQTGVSPYNYNISLCRQDQKQLLLQLSHHLHPDQSDEYWKHKCDLPKNYYKTMYWKESRDCCDWDGVTCDDSTGFVISLDLSCGGLAGTIHSNSTLFRLHSLNLAFNNFSASQISPKLGWLSSLTHLNLSHSEFSGPVPQELYYLSNLISLDMSWNDNVYCDLKLLFKNMTKIEVLLLSYTNISSEIPTNMSSFLSHLDLGITRVHGNLPMNFFERPNFQVLKLGGNLDLKGSLPSTLNGSNVHSFRELDLSQTSVSGMLPESIGLFNNLVYMDLRHTNISDRLPESIGMLNNLVRMDLSSTNISGRLPESIGLLKNLVEMDISECNLWGPIPESIGNITVMKTMDMSFNKLNGQVPSSISNLRQIKMLDLSQNHLGGQLPDAFSNLQNLSQLLLNDNSFVGQIPSSLSNMSQLQQLDISSNALTSLYPSTAGSLLQNLLYLDLSHNRLREYQPWPHLHNLKYLFLHSNELEGSFPSSICNITSLDSLYLSNNKFSGELPPCIGNSTNSLRFLVLSNNTFRGKLLGNYSDALEILDLSRNEISGTIPTGLGNNQFLRILDLSDNQVEGPLPRSLSGCTQLKALDLGNNLIDDSFPWWLPHLRVLVLKFNNFHGFISPPVSNSSFSELVIMDLSHNNFTGRLPDKLFATLQAIKENSDYHSLMVDVFQFGYSYSVTLSVKQGDREFTSLRPILTTIDLSSNNFYGSIPESLADLTSLWLLNLSHNAITGSIPPALGHLATLEQLDLSSNQLTGGIPHTLTNLTFLGSLNLSYNHLVGPIPEGNQFSTFPRESYVGNVGLYGAPLTKNYGNGKAPPSTIALQKDEGDGSSLMMGFTWQAVAIGYGCGIVIGFILGSVMLSIGKPRWFARFYYAQEANCVNRRKKMG